MNAVLESEKRGSLTNAGDQTLVQRVNISQGTRRNIATAIQNTIDTYIDQSDQSDQVIRGIRISKPCKGNVKLSNAYFLEQLSRDMTENIAQAVINSDDANVIRTAAEGTSKQKASDTLVELGDALQKMVSNVASSFSMIGVMYILFLFGVVYLLIRFLPSLLSSVSNNSNSTSGGPTPTGEPGGGGGGGGLLNTVLGVRKVAMQACL